MSGMAATLFNCIMQSSILSCIFVSLLFGLTFNQVQAATVQLTFKNGLTARADFRKGEENMPAILLLHGFLQTHQFSTVQSITDELTDSGYTILAPTLSHGIDNRLQSLTCDTIQSHKFGDHHSELDSWVNWLKEKGYQELIFIGHSTGCLRLLSYINYNPLSSLKVHGLILISPTTPNTKTDDRLKKQINYAKSLGKDNKSNLEKFSLAYCQNNYIASPNAFLSYASLDEHAVIDFMNKTPYPIINILGTKDNLLPDNWINTLSEQKSHIFTIEEANHFFSNGQELELYDALHTAIEQILPANEE